MRVKEGGRKEGRERRKVGRGGKEGGRDTDGGWQRAGKMN